MKFVQPPLPYAPDALSDAISPVTIDYHYGKHEKAYIDNLNRLIEGTKYADMPLERIIVESDGALFNNASQAWNHIFYFFQFSPKGLKMPGGALMERIEKDFGSFEEFQKKFEEAGVGVFGSGWVWLANDADGKLEIIKASNAENPLCMNLNPLLVFDVWEHAYYLDYQNRRADYLHRLWDIVDWSVIESRYPF
ncbi:MAG: superoxide dismutase [Bacteroides sp.]|nr:superoxide dismutase [Bacteroides sp.]MBD5419250.1 superoxide dismutase [Bacteroides sp.]MDE7462070.1 superoxide dismutase [Muribaculaceae bacterium]